MFHRLTAPTYFIPGGGPLPAGYDYLNDPVTGGSGSGIAAPADTGAKSGGVYDGTYFVAEDGEQVNAFNANRPAFALGQNTDQLDDVINGDVAVAAFVTTNPGHGGASGKAINASTDGMWLSVSGGTALTDLFAVTDFFGDPIVIAGTIVAVVSIAGATVGDGFVQANPVTLTFNKTIPTQIGFRVHYGIQSSYSRVPQGTFSRNDIYRNRKLRGIVAAISDTVNSTSGDFNATSVDVIIDAAQSYFGTGRFALNSPGLYKISTGAAGWSQRTQFISDGGVVSIDVGRAANVTVSALVRLEGISLTTASTTGIFDVTGEFDYDGTAGNCSIQMGCLKINTTSGKHVSLRGATSAGNATLTAVTSGLLITGGGFITLADLDFSIGAATASAGYATCLKVDTFDGILRVENSKFTGTGAGVSALTMAAAFGEIRFVNCEFICATAGAGFGVTANGCSGIIFENCRITATSGQVLQAVNSGIQFIGCTFISGSNTSLTNPQMIAGEGFVAAGSHVASPLTFTNCYAKFTAANVRASGAPTKPIIELGGHAAAFQAGEVLVRGLHVVSDGAAGRHNYTTVVLHSGTQFEKPNTFTDVTIDMFDQVPDAVGTLGVFNSSFDGKGLVLEAVGITDRPRLVLNNLRILNAGWPTTDVARSVAGFAFCDVNGFTLDGSPSSSGSFTKVMVDSIESTMHDVRFFPTAGLKSTSTSVMIARLSKSEMHGLRYHHRDSFDESTAAFFDVGLDSQICGALIYIDSEMTGGFPVVAFSESRAVMRDSTIFMGEVVDGPLILAVQSEMDFSHNNVTWQNGDGDTGVIASLVPSNGVVIGNRFVATSASTPTVSYTPTASIPASAVEDLNVVNVSAIATPPQVY